MDNLYPSQKVNLFKTFWNYMSTFWNYVMGFEWFSYT